MWLSTQRIGKDIRTSSYFFTRRAADVVSEACFTVMTGDRHDERAAMDFSMIIPNCTQNRVITYTKIIFLVMPFGQIWGLYLGVQWICFLSLIRLKVIGILYSGACWIPTLLWKNGVSKGNSYLNGSTVKFKPQWSRGTICIEKKHWELMLQILFVMLSAIFTETQLATALKILKTFGALFVVFCPPNVLNYQFI